MIEQPTDPCSVRAYAHYGGVMNATRHVRFESAPGISLVMSAFDDAAGPISSPTVPVLLLHGLSQQRAFWGPVVRRMHSRPVAALDQRGHGESDTPLGSDFSVSACADDVVAALDHLGWPHAIVVGHSWGGSVALAAAARHSTRIAAAVLIDGGLWSPSGLGPRDEIRARLTPPELGLPADDLWALIRRGDLGEGWSDERQAALAPTFIADGDGNLSTRIGVARHLAVLDGLLDHDVAHDLAVCESHRVPIWAAVCDPAGPAQDSAGLDGSWQDVKQAAVHRAERIDGCLVHRWRGGVHDVPLQWPALVAGFVDAAVESQGGGET
jgi:pimeloyl-ACP methyl ester carboxylesterase